MTSKYNKIAINAFLDEVSLALNFILFTFVTVYLVSSWKGFSLFGVVYPALTVKGLSAGIVVLISLMSYEFSKLWLSSSRAKRVDAGGSELSDKLVLGVSWSLVTFIFMSLVSRYLGYSFMGISGEFLSLPVFIVFVLLLVISQSLVFITFRSKKYLDAQSK